MRATVESRDWGSMAATSSVLNPAVRGVTDANRPLSSFWLSGIGPRVDGLDHSKAVSTTNPASRRAAVVVIVTLAWRLSGRQRPRERVRSTRTGKPSPPITIAAMTGTSTHGSPAKRTRLSG